jgi:drug/metabolite transporter (DMT)-like permease
MTATLAIFAVPIVLTLAAWWHERLHMPAAFGLFIFLVALLFIASP